MKKSFLVLLTVLTSTSSFALPISSSELITEALTNNQDVRDFLEKNTVRGFRPGAVNYDKMTAEKVSRSEVLPSGVTAYDFCADEGSGSRSGSVLKVTVSGTNYNGGIARPFTRSLYLATPQSAAALEVCK